MQADHTNLGQTVDWPWKAKSDFFHVVQHAKSHVQFYRFRNARWKDLQH